MPGDSLDTERRPAEAAAFFGSSATMLMFGFDLRLFELRLVFKSGDDSWQCSK
jgi:hypothetical protein